MRMAVEIEIDEIGQRFFSSASRDLTEPDQAPKGLDDLDVHEMWRVEVVVGAKEPSLDSCAKGSLQEHLEQRRRIDHDHAESRSSRITAAAVVLRTTRLRP